MLLKKPFPAHTSPLRRMAQAAFFGLFVSLFLFLFQPFGMSCLGSKLPAIAVGYGLVCFGAMFFLNVLIPIVLKSYFQEENWTIGREIAWSTLNVLAIGLFNFLFSVYVNIAEFTIEHMLTFEFYTLLIGVFPVVFLAFLKERKLSAFYHASTQKVNQILDRQATPSEDLKPTPLLLPSDTGKSLSCTSNEVLYIKSDDNYCEVFLLRHHLVERHVLRQTLKNMEALLEAHPVFYRCHKSYVVNLAQVIHVSGNAQGYKLHFSQHTGLVPVSRSKNDEIKTKLLPYH